MTNNLGDFYGDEVSFSTNDIPCDVVYLDENGVTIKACPDANVGDVGTVNGVQYTVVDREMLDQMLLDEEDVSKVCTTRITDMSYMFYDFVNFSPHSFAEDFNQPIGSWDVGNVTDMSYMFWGTSEFNQDIGSWDVSNVTDMEYMFYGGIFNQPIGDWDVSNVTNMERMFHVSDFNQPIGDWDVSNVTNMYDMFDGSIFNQPIGDWDVSSVTDMTGMFRYSDFNQSIGNWDVSSVNSMTRMFLGNDSFNQDLSNWGVENVIYCIEFSINANQWTLPQPNFTNCNP